MNENTYQDSNIIQGPGKFEGEPTFAPHFYDLWLEGASDDDIQEPNGTLTSIFIVQPDERKLFPYIAPETYVVALSEDNDGFVWTDELTDGEYRKWLNSLDYSN